MTAKHSIDELATILIKAQQFLVTYKQKGDRNSVGLAPICAIDLTFYDERTAHRIARFASKPKAMGILKAARHSECMKYEQEVRESLLHYLGPNSGQVKNIEGILPALILGLQRHQ